MINRLALLALTLAVLATAAAPAQADLAAQRRSAVSWAVDQVGVRENGTSNCSPVINRWVRRMDLSGCRPWCGAFVHEAFRQAGIDLSARLIDPDRTYDDVVNGRRGLRQIPKSQVRPGDLLLFAIRSGLRASHMEIVRTSPRNGKVRTVGGNVSHAVRSKTRGLSYAVLAARVVG